MSWTTLVAAGVAAAVIGVVCYLRGWQQGREWVWRRERDYWKENQ